MPYRQIDNIYHDTNGLAREMYTFFAKGDEPLANGVFRDGNIVHHYKNGLLHREDGPAVYSLISNYKLWAYNNKYIDVSSQKEFEKLLKLKIFW